MTSKFLSLALTSLTPIAYLTPLLRCLIDLIFLRVFTFHPSLSPSLFLFKPSPQFTAPPFTQISKPNTQSSWIFLSLTSHPICKSISKTYQLYFHIFLSLSLCSLHPLLSTLAQPTGLTLPTTIASISLPATYCPLHRLVSK